MNYQELRAALNAVVFENTTGEITGEKLNTILQRIISTLGAGARFVGIATPELVPPTPDNIVFYMATTAGEYPGFGEGVSLDGKTLHLFVSGPEEGWVDIPTSISTGVLTAEAIATALGYVPASTAVRFNVQSDEYLTFPASRMSLAVIIEHEDNVLPPIFVTGDNYEQFFVSAVEGWDIPVSFVSGTIEDGNPVIAIHNGIDGEGSIPVVVKVVSLPGDELPEIFVSEEGGFDEEPTLFPVRYLYAKPAGGIPASDMASGVQTSLSKADTALQPVSGATNGNLAGLNSQGKVVDSGKKPSDFAAANLVPAQASPSNQLADKNFVNSSIQTETATFRGNWETFGDIPNDAYMLPEGDADNNDYLVVRNAGDYAKSYDVIVAEYEEDGEIPEGIVVADGLEHGSLVMYISVQSIDLGSSTPRPSADSSHDYWEPFTGENPAFEGTWRFKYVPSGGEYDKYNWIPEYQVNEKPLTAAQLAAINSGITTAKVNKLDALPTRTELTQEEQALDKVFFATNNVT
ncbi:MAG: hypothetical protein II661_09975, partial [Bacteroidales bacterium]|nr:hypothetical protein [Bacteroidales bacterium]